MSPVDGRGLLGAVSAASARFGVADRLHHLRGSALAVEQPHHLRRIRVGRHHSDPAAPHLLADLASALSNRLVGDGAAQHQGRLHERVRRPGGDLLHLDDHRGVHPQIEERAADRGGGAGAQHRRRQVRSEVRRRRRREVLSLDGHREQPPVITGRRRVRCCPLNHTEVGASEPLHLAGLALHHPEVDAGLVLEGVRADHRLVIVGQVLDLDEPGAAAHLDPRQRLPQIRPLQRLRHPLFPVGALSCDVGTQRLRSEDPQPSCADGDGQPRRAERAQLWLPARHDERAQPRRPPHRSSARDRRCNARGHRSRRDDTTPERRQALFGDSLGGRLGRAGDIDGVHAPQRPQPPPAEPPAEQRRQGDRPQSPVPHVCPLAHRRVGVDRGVSQQHREGGVGSYRAGSGAQRPERRVRNRRLPPALGALLQTAVAGGGQPPHAATAAEG